MKSGSPKDLLCLLSSETPSRGPFGQALLSDTELRTLPSVKRRPPILSAPNLTSPLEPRPRGASFAASLPLPSDPRQEVECGSTSQMQAFPKSEWSLSLIVPCPRLRQPVPRHPVVLSVIVRLHFLCHVFLAQKTHSSCSVAVSHCLGRQRWEGSAYNVTL